MTATKTVSIKEIAMRYVTQEKVETSIESLGTAWRRAIREKGIALGKFDRDRTDLTPIESNFVLNWFQKRQDEPAEISDPTPPSVSAPNAKEQIKSAVDVEVAKMQKRFDEKLETELQERMAAELTRIGLETNAKLAEQKAALLKDASNDTFSKIEQTRKAEAVKIQDLNAQLLKLEAEKAAIQTQLVEERFERDGKHNEQLNAQAAQFRAANAEKDAAHQAAIEGIEAEKQKLKEEIQALKTPGEWWRISEYDIVNITSNGFAAFSLYNMLQGYGILAAIILILTFRGIIKALKKSTSDWAVWFGMIGIVIIEFIYGALHTTLFKGILEGKEHLPFGMPYEWVANALAIIVSGTSIYVAIMTRAQTSDDAESQRIAEIDARLSQTK